MAKQEESRALRDIHRIESNMFWIERLALVPLASQFPYFQHRLALVPLASQFPYFQRRLALVPLASLFPYLQLLMSCACLLLIATNAIYLTLSIRRQFIRNFFFEPDIIFYIQRPVILTLILNHVLPDGCFIAAFIAWLVLIGTTYYDYKKEQDKESRMKSSLSSKTNGSTAREASKDGKILKKEEAMVEDEGLKEMSAMTRNYKGFHKWFIDAVSKWDTMLKEFAERPKGFHKWFFDTLSEWDTMLKEVAGHGQELKTAEDRSEEQQDRASEDSEDSDFEKIEDAMKD
ncbi:Uncharacterized protein TCM_006590 [Theobroma cacao]|uniref:Uncharacterized protein n=1 Tax=Theobroma cacao TaxID=3641 RepID=A0A061DYY0_THECC|nr:Uncharacterized protein TCM_006590 [Theobroma cacao]